jgi:ornithine decarboxylase
MARHISAGAEDPFFVVDLDAVLARVHKWYDLLPGVEPFYAVKCQPDVELIRTLASAGVNFDCASRGEIDLILRQGVDPSRIIYANPCKQPNHLRYAAAAGINMSTFDSEAELLKTAANAGPAHELVLRIKVDDSKAQCVMSDKYGAPLSAVPGLLRRAAELGLRVRGVSFHVGSGCYSAQAYVAAVKRAEHVFDLAADMGLPMDLLDIGGGFPGIDSVGVSFGQIAAALRPALAASFPASRGVRIIAEPGRYMSSSSMTLAVNVIGKKVVADPAAAGGSRTMYYVNDGVYGSFNCIFYDHHVVREVEVAPTSQAFGRSFADADGARRPASIWGPTCDGLDCVMPDTKLPDLEVGQWLYFPDMGAYTSAAGSNFNGMALPSKLYTSSEQEECMILNVDSRAREPMQQQRQMRA